jgi:hypothetical protein
MPGHPDGSSTLGRSALETPSEGRSPLALASCQQPYLGSRTAEEAAAARNSDFAGCRGNRVAELGRDRGRCGQGAIIVWLGHGFFLKG